MEVVEVLPDFVVRHSVFFIPEGSFSGHENWSSVCM